MDMIIDEVKLKEEIMQVNQKIKTLFEEEKVDEIVKHYTEDCKFIFLPESQTISGRSGAADAYKQELEEYHATSLEFKTVEVGAMGSMDMAYERGDSYFYDANKEIISQARYVVIWKRINGTMHIYVDVAQPTNESDVTTSTTLPI